MIYAALFDTIYEGTVIFKGNKEVPMGVIRCVPIKKEVAAYHIMAVGQAMDKLKKENSLSQDDAMPNLLNNDVTIHLSVLKEK